ncbi:hypothetical protein IFM89_032273 [Coptis chinensis]|uniref:Expansin n=1 Tax=Coptis chinensis TaxID=261450 RepID=A0A835IGL2_9MAGN|nr:hypothetical protein IFM89_032273 [Coptis chinensis]
MAMKIVLALIVVYGLISIVDAFSRSDGQKPMLPFMVAMMPQEQWEELVGMVIYIPIDMGPGTAALRNLAFCSTMGLLVGNAIGSYVTITQIQAITVDGAIHHSKDFDMAQTAWEKIGIYRGESRPHLQRLVPCKKHGGVRFTINGRDYFELVLVSNVGGSGSIQFVSIKGSKTGWLTMSRNWGANWQSNSYLNDQSLSFKVITTDGETRFFP